jgi:hypothetical protein
MEWYDYIACFFSGMFLANVVPHFVNGISGNRFPTPFANPRGKALSSPLVNVVWSLMNLVVGAALLRFGKLLSGDDWGTLLFFAGIAVASTILSKGFANKDAS